MAVTAKQLREKMGAKAKEVQQLRDKITRDDYKHDAEDDALFARLSGEFAQLEAQAQQLERMDDILKERNDGGENPQRRLRERPERRNSGEAPTGPITPEERTLAIQGRFAQFFGGVRAERLSPEHRSAMKRCEGLIVREGRSLVIRLDNNRADLQSRQQSLAWERGGSSAQQRALAWGGGSGNTGVLGTDDFVQSLETNLLAHGPMLQIADVWRTDHGRNLPYPYVDDTGNEGTIVGEAADVSATQDPTFGETVWGAYKLRSKKVVYSSESTEDVMFNLPGILGQILGERLGRGANRYCTTGTGSSQPTGAVYGAATGVTAASATTFTADEVINLIHSVDPAYRSGAGFGLMLHDTVLAFIMKLKDGDGNYLYKFADGTANTIYGKRYQINQHMDSAFTASKELIAAGDFSRYVVRQVRDIRLRRYVELHGDNDQDAVQAFLRLDGKIRNTGTAPIKKLKLAAS